VADKPALLYGPAYIAGSNTNIYQGGGGSALIYDRVTAIYIANTDPSNAVTFTIYLGATGGSTGGTELFKGVSIPAATTVPFYFAGPGIKLTSTQYLVGSASSASKLTITITGFQAVV
jgi:hypothetical protein